MQDQHRGVPGTQASSTRDLASESDEQLTTRDAETSAAALSSAAGEARPKKPPPEQRRRCMSDKFMLYTYKIKLCKRQDPHNWRLCPYAHPGEAGRRRPPHTYQAVMCDFNKTRKECPHGDKCPLARNALEYWLHPDKYRTILCGHGEACNRNICFFAHNPSELRTPSSAASDEQLSADLAAATASLQQLSVAPHLAAAAAGSSSQQLLYGDATAAACPFLPTGAGSSRAAGAGFSGGQAPQPLQVVQVVGADGQQQQLLVPMPAAAVESQVQAAAAMGSPSYQAQGTSTLVSSPYQVSPGMALLQPTAGTMAMQQPQAQWAYEQLQGYQQHQQMMLGGATLPAGAAPQSPGSGMVASAAGAGPAMMGALQQQMMGGPGMSYQAVPTAAHPLVLGQQQFQPLYAQQQYQQYIQPQYQHQQMYYQQQGPMMMLAQPAQQTAGPSGSGAARYIQGTHYQESKPAD